MPSERRYPPALSYCPNAWQLLSLPSSRCREKHLISPARWRSRLAMQHPHWFRPEKLHVPVRRARHWPTLNHPITTSNSPSPNGVHGQNLRRYFQAQGGCDSADAPCPGMVCLQTMAGRRFSSTAQQMRLSAIAATPYVQGRLACGIAGAATCESQRSSSVQKCSKSIFGYIQKDRIEQLLFGRPFTD